MCSRIFGYISLAYSLYLYWKVWLAEGFIYWFATLITGKMTNRPYLSYVLVTIWYYIAHYIMNHIGIHGKNIISNQTQ